MFVKPYLGGRILPTGLSLFGWHTKAVLRSGSAALSAAAGMTSASTVTPASLFISNKFREGRCVCCAACPLGSIVGRNEAASLCMCKRFTAVQSTCSSQQNIRVRSTHTHDDAHDTSTCSAVAVKASKFRTIYQPASTISSNRALRSRNLCCGFSPFDGMYLHLNHWQNSPCARVCVALQRSVCLVLWRNFQKQSRPLW